MIRRKKKARVPSLKTPGLPKEFRIEPGSWPEDLVRAIKDLSDSAHTRAENRDTIKDRVNFLAALATRLWPVRQKMLKPGTEEPLEEISNAFRHLLSVFD